jgi:hypothetical protein
MLQLGLGLCSLPVLAGGVGAVGVIVSGTFVEGSDIDLLADEDFVGAGTSVEFFVNAVSIGTDASGPPWTETDPAVTPGQKAYTIEVDGGDPSPATIITVTAQAPTLTEPDGGEIVVEGSIFQFTATTFDDSVTADVDFHVTGPSSYDETFAGTLDTGVWEYAWDTTGLIDGFYSVTAVRSGSWGSVSSTPASITIADEFDYAGMTGLVDGWLADRGVNTTSGVVWTGLNGNLLSAVTSAPTFNASDATVDGFPSFSFVRANSDRLQCLTIDRPAPGTTPTFILLILKQTAWTTSGTPGIFNAGSARLSIFPAGSTPQLSQSNGTARNNNGGAVIGTWVPCGVYFANSTADFIQCLATLTGALAAGNNDPTTTITVGGNAGLTSFADFDLVGLFIFSQKPVAAELADMMTDLGGKLAKDFSTFVLP